MTGDRKLTSFFVTQAKKHKGRYLFAFSLMPIIALLSVAGPKLLQLAIDDGIKAGDHRMLLRYAFSYLGVLLALFVMDAMQGIVMQTAGICTLREVRATIVRHVSHLGKSVYEKFPLGVFVSRATSDVEAIGESLATGLTSILKDALTICAICAFLVYRNPKFGLVMMLLLLGTFCMIEWFRRVLRRLHGQIRTINARLAAQVNEGATMRLEIRNFHLAPRFLQEFQTNNHLYRDTNLKAVSLDACTFSIVEGLSHVTIGGILLLSTLPWFSDEALTIGEISMYIHYLGLLFAPFKQLSQRFTVLQSTYAALHKIHDTMDLPLPGDAGTRKVTDTRVTMRDVDFSYPGSGKTLEGINLDIQAGQSLALVGHTGSGKTTIARLLTRQYDVVHGSISIGGVNICDIPRRDLKNVVTLVPQDPVIFQGTVHENIALSRPGITLNQVREVCRNIQADSFIEKMPHGYATVLASEGANISMGQRQLIALARALVSGAEILLFDESTANIDSETERLIQGAMDYVMTQKTTIIIAHRLSTIRHVDEIVVLQGGRIVDSGSHAELISRPGLYRDIAQRNL